jgi:hypothetical protein
MMVENRRRGRLLHTPESSAINLTPLVFSSRRALVILGYWSAVVQEVLQGERIARVEK